jgi:hypothetical protein
MAILLSKYIYIYLLGIIMKFGIQVSNPKFSGLKDPEDKTLDECIETSFLFNTETAFIVWLGVFIPLHYKYTISTILLDILMMLQVLFDKQDGDLDITWPSNDFNAQWNMSWQGNSLTINAQWVSVIGKTENLLNNLGALKLSKSEFIGEWKPLLEMIIVGLNKCGYNESNVRNFKKLKEIHSRIEGTGLLYK